VAALTVFSTRTFSSLRLSEVLLSSFFGNWKGRAGSDSLPAAKSCSEAAANLERKRPDAAPRPAVLLVSVGEALEPNEEELEKARRVLPEKDAPVLAAALATEASVLTTGDVKHFGSLMQRRDLKLRIRTPRPFCSKSRS